MKKDIKRRNAITKLAALGAGVATLRGQWYKPVVQTALLPAHAQSSLVTLNATLNVDQV